jgi:hypothetical protein
MMITPEKIEMWKKDPAQWDYERGYDAGSLDAYTQYDPIVFTIEHSKSFRLGYKQGWANSRAHLEIDQIYHEEFNEELLSRLVEYNYKKVHEDLRMLAEVPDDDVPGYSEDDWKQAMNFLEHPGEAIVERPVYHKYGMVIREDYE